MEILIYVGKVSLYWTLFYACYWLLLRQQTFFVWNRIYLISALLISFALPFVIYPESAPAIPAVYYVSSSAVTINTSSAEQFSLLTWAHFLWSVYILGTLFMSFRLYTHSRQLTTFLKEGELIELDGYKLILIDSNRVGSFSFLKWIVVNRNDYENHFDAILRHEMVHMQQWHSLDILLVEVMKVIFWFNPVLLLYKKSLQEVHEFLADYEAPSRESYAVFLISYALNAPVASLTNHFYKPSQIKTRIQMIYKNRSSKWLLGSYLLIFGMISIVALLVSGCEQKESSELPEVSKKAAEKKSVNLEGKKIYTVVENQPEFPGGETAMWKFLGQNIKYPQAAVKANIQGRVFLSFVVTETGEIADIQVLKGIGYGCDEESVRVLSMFPKLKPAMQGGVPVNVKFNLPINFQLEETKKTSRIEKKFNNPDGSETSLTTDGRTIQVTAKDNGEKAYIVTASPLYVIDGKIEEDPEIIKKIDPKNILSVNVLKDQKAIEAYGKKGEHGVVSIVTKKS
jgi:TonB family protein